MQQWNTYIKSVTKLYYHSVYVYRFCARLNLSPNDHSHIALHIHLMRTGHDDSLSWPFTGRITFMLVNATDSSRHICDTVMSRPELHAFKRPLRDMNLLGFGYTEFVSVHDLLISTQGFVTPDDSILIKLHILSVWRGKCMAWFLFRSVFFILLFDSLKNLHVRDSQCPWKLKILFNSYASMVPLYPFIYSCSIGLVFILTHENKLLTVMSLQRLLHALLNKRHTAGL